MAPTLLGGPRLAVGDIGVETIAEQRRLDVASVERLGDDLLIVGRLVSPPAAARDATGEDMPAATRSTIEKETR